MRDDEIDVRFVKTHTKQDSNIGSPREKRYLAGQTYPMNRQSARHYVKRGLAEYVGAAPLAQAQPLTSMAQLSEMVDQQPRGSQEPSESTPPSAETIETAPSTSDGSQTGEVKSPPSSPPVRPRGGNRRRNAGAPVAASSPSTPAD